MSALLSTRKTARVAIIGNPNTGKSTIFNALTGKRQRVGNYPGVTVEKRTGTFTAGECEITLIDLPGAYSLAATSPDERVAVDLLTGQGDEASPDLVICVVDASNLKRNLFLVRQIADFGLPLIVALNLCDEAAGRGIHVNAEILSRGLGVPVVPMAAIKKDGLAELRHAVGVALRKQLQPPPTPWPEPVQQAIADLRAVAPGIDDSLLRRILFDANSALLPPLGKRGAAIREHLSQARRRLFSAGWNPHAAEALLIYDELAPIVHAAENSTGVEKQGRWTKLLDAILMHRAAGLLVFLAMMFLVFQSIYTWATPMMDAIEAGTTWLQAAAGEHLQSMPALSSLVTEGIVPGVGGVLVFLPQILVLFFFISLLEDTGYMARAAFLMDRLFSWCGLNGKCFVPLLSSYACAVPGILSTRTIEDPKARLTTILIAPLMSCSARLPIYVLMIGAFIEPKFGPGWAAFTLLAMHLLGLAIALPAAFVMTRVLKTAPQPFILELPPFRRPLLRNVLWRMWERGREFLMRAGTVILALSIVIWALVYYPRPESVAQKATAQYLSENPGVTEAELADASSPQAEELAHKIDTAYVEQSYLGRLGQAVQPAFGTAGFDWKITLAVLASFPAREVFVATMGILYSLGDEVDESSDSLRERMASELRPDGTPVFTIPVVLAVMVFFSLCMQCAATVAVIAREAGTCWAIGAFFALTGIAWLFATLIYQIL